ncbi:Fe-S cluster assembly protein SufD [Marinicrinis lubricantis]|uniref:Fe-S cluster assembly protein SufD n=1 Tax=Marinicrinis lubricantis TaxID=2086470 RepID=A0ABW1IH19_9BACL
MTTEIILPVGREAVESASKSKNEPQWLTELRLSALDKAGQLELPKLEKTRLDRWKMDGYGEYKPAAAISQVNELPEEFNQMLQTNQEGHNLIVQRNSAVVLSHLASELQEQGVIFMSLEEAAKQHSDLVQKHLFTAVKSDEHKLSALHAAIWNGGVFLYVPKNVQIDIPLQAMFVHDEEQAAFSPHILIVADENSSVKYVDVVTSTETTSAQVHSGIAEVIVKPGAKVTFASIHHLSKEITDLSFRRAIVEKDGQVEWIVGEMNYGNAVSDTTSILKGSGSASDAKVICVGTNDQKLNVTTKAVHFGKSSNSDMITRAAMRDEATAIFNGITKIEKGATHANGEQTERVLMLSPKARGDANPMLLIDEDDVKAGHAASAGQVNKEQIYYLMSRGISREQATKLIIYGFLEPIVAEIPIKELEELLSNIVERKLGQ